MADLKTKAIILKRVNYHESDRIVTLLTPEGRFSCLAKGVRREKSKIAGGIELFSLSSVVIHQRDITKKNHLDSEDHAFGILTSAQMLEFYSHILADLEALEIASAFLKRTHKITNQLDSKEIFLLLAQSLASLNQAVGDPIKKCLIEIFFTLNISRICGEEINMLYDQDGHKLDPLATYDWDDFAKVLVKKETQTGYIDQNIIKMVRLILSSKLSLVLQVKDCEKYLPALSRIEHSFQPVSRGII